MSVASGVSMFRHRKAVVILAGFVCPEGLSQESTTRTEVCMVRNEGRSEPKMTDACMTPSANASKPGVVAPRCISSANANERENVCVAIYSIKGLERRYRWRDRQSIVIISRDYAQ